ncbi:MAG: hypothetical protein ACSHXY_09300 [Alphaproteobacteria bacterium]
MGNSLICTTAIVTLFVSSMSITASAQTPPEVLEAYKAYSAAFADEDYDAALKQGKAAWKIAESKMGDSKTTGDLAFNYGYLAKSQGLAKESMISLERAVELSGIDRDKGAEVRLERSVELISAAENAGDGKAVENYADEALVFAEKKNLASSVFAGEILVHRAIQCSQSVNRSAKRLIGKPTSSRLAVQMDQRGHVAKMEKRCAADAARASEIFASLPVLARPKYIALASKQVGFAFEREQDWLKAALSYQTARQAIESEYGRDNPLAMQLIGRWINARSRLSFEGRLENAKAAGLCDCWPFDVGESKVRATKRVKPDMPTNAITIKSSGVVVLKTDVSDAGAPQNISVVYSWPEGEYDEPAIKAYQQYEFAPKTGSEFSEARNDIVESFSFILYNEDNKETF